MIPPKEKAEELLNKMLKQQPVVNLKLATRHFTKQSALICVDEILNAYEFGGASSTQDINYWNEVKTELESK